MLKWLAVAFSIMFLLLGMADNISAHAYIQDSSPVQESELNNPPELIKIAFTEPINLEVSQLTLLTEQGEKIETKQLSEDNNVLLLEIPPLPDGVYIVKWQVLSLDTHFTDGSFRFSVGVELPPLQPSESIIITNSADGSQYSTAKQEIRVLATVLKSTENIVLFCLIGTFFFVHFILGENTPSLLRQPFNKKTEFILYLIFSTVLVLSGICQLLLNSLLLINSSVTDSSVGCTFITLAITTPAGIVTLIRPLFIITYLVLVSKESNRWLLLLSVCMLVFTYSISSHAFSYSIVIPHFVHVIAVAVWCGGLLGLVIYSFNLGDTTVKLRFLHTCLTRFSFIALILVLAVILTGTIMSLAFTGNWEHFTSTRYGEILLLKIFLLIIILLIAGFHRFIWLEEFKALAPDENNKSKLRKTVLLLRLELIVLLITVIAAGILSQTPPPAEINNFEKKDHIHHYNTG